MVSFDEGGWGFERVVGMERVDAAIPPVVARIFSGDSTSPLTREARIWCEAKALLLYQNDNERIYHAKKCINYAESGINRNPFLPPLEKGEVARLI